MSVQHFVDYVNGAFGAGITDINVIFIPKQSLQRTKYGQYCLKVCGIIIKQNGKNKAITYDKLLEVFDGDLRLYIKESKTRKIIPSTTLEMLKIKNTMETFNDKNNGDKIAYYPASTCVTSSETAKKLYQKMLDFEAANDDEHEEESDIEFI